jgi:DNA repair protein RadA/Sms
MTKTIYRGIGSIDMLAASRSVLLVGADAADRDRRAVVHVKSNLAPMGDSLGYALMDGRFEWTGTSTMTAGDIHAAEASAGGGEDSIDEAIEFLSDALAGGSVTSAMVETQAKRLGISRSTLNRARKELGVKSKKETDARGRLTGWVMSLPGKKVAEAA